MDKVESYLGRAGYPVRLGGAFGPAGEDAVRRYQADKGLKVDGLLNPGGETESSLRRQLSLPAVGRVRKVRNPDLDALADGAPFHNRRTVEHLMTTAEDGDLPRFMATAFANDGAAGRGEVVDLLDQLGKRDPGRARSLRAKVDRLLPDGVAVPEATLKVRDAPPQPEPQPAPPAEKPPDPGIETAEKQGWEECRTEWIDTYQEQQKVYPLRREVAGLDEQIQSLKERIAALKNGDNGAAIPPRPDRVLSPSERQPRDPKPSRGGRRGGSKGGALGSALEGAKNGAEWGMFKQDLDREALQHELEKRLVEATAQHEKLKHALDLAEQGADNQAAILRQCQAKHGS